MAFIACLNQTKIHFFLLFTLYALSTAALSGPLIPPLQLAKVYADQDIRLYLVSEKYDGIRAIWKNNQLTTRQGNIIHAPSWFIQSLPDIWLDGELWFERGNFEFVMSTVSKHTPIDAQWRKIKYMVFDAPHPHLEFSARAKRYTKVVNQIAAEHVLAAPQFYVQSNTELMSLLAQYTQKGAEGLMLHKADATFEDGRSDNLLKLKAFMDAEATVIQHLGGKGKYQHSLGSLLVKFTHPSGKIVTFKIGTGFSDAERRVPPAIGQTITFKYHGFTKNGVPRFASYMREYRARP